MHSTGENLILTVDPQTEAAALAMCAMAKRQAALHLVGRLIRHFGSYKEAAAAIRRDIQAIREGPLDKPLRGRWATILPPDPEDDEAGEESNGAERLTTWDAQQHLRPDTQQGQLIDGYGPDGSIKLWFPSPTQNRRIAFKGGRAIVETMASCFEQPALRRLRDRLICATLVLEPALRQMAMQPLLHEYSTAMIQRGYAADDAAISYLHRGSKWMDGALRHAMDGDGVEQVLIASAGTDPPPVQPPKAVS